MRVRAVRRGFTILEILISIVVLVIGITGIVALFPTAIDSGKRTVDDSYAAAIAQSVVDSINAGIRDTMTAGPSTYFIFNHDGVLDAAPADASDFAGESLHEKDYTVLLPNGNNALIYPVPHYTGGFHAAALIGQRAGGAQLDNFQVGLKNASDVGGALQLWIPRTYPLGRYRDGGGGTKGNVRNEYRVQDLVPGVTDPRLIAADSYCKYSFAFGLKRGRMSSPPPAAAGAMINGLIELRVMVFKDFDQAAADQLAPKTDFSPTGGAGLSVPKSNVPIHQFVTMVNP